MNLCSKRAENQKPVIFSRKAAKTQKEESMTENEIAKIVVDAAYHIHRRLGPGLLKVEKLAPVHKNQLLTNMRLADKGLGLR